jgi:hypothetical protein
MPVRFCGVFGISCELCRRAHAGRLMDSGQGIDTRAYNARNGALQPALFGYRFPSLTVQAINFPSFVAIVCPHMSFPCFSGTISNSVVCDLVSVFLIYPPCLSTFF